MCWTSYVLCLQTRELCLVQNISTFLSYISPLHISSPQNSWVMWNISSAAERNYLSIERMAVIRETVWTPQSALTLWFNSSVCTSGLQMFFIMHPLKVFEHKPQYIPIHKLYVWISVLIYYTSYKIFFKIREIKKIL